MRWFSRRLLRVAFVFLSVAQLVFAVKKAGDQCHPDDFTWYPAANPMKFLYCDTRYGRLVEDTCAMVNGFQKTFDEASQQCVIRAANIQRQPAATGSGRVGDVCVFNTDCLQGMFCSSGLCACRSNYVSRDFYCYIKVNPSQSGCTYDEQCRAVWPASTCISNVCNCPSPLSPEQTRDGWVCIDRSTTTQKCALPESAGELTVLTTGGAAVTCTVGTACQSNGQTLDTMYDCVRSDSSGTGACCPSRAFTCIQPRFSGGVGTMQTRWWYNSVTGTCEQFSWSAAGGRSTANNFRTREHCESYCKDTCSRGAPQYTFNTGSNNVVNVMSCAGTTACDTNHQCVTIGSFQNCCPSTDWICSANGGTARTSPNGDVGISVANSNGGLPGVRWYYSPTISQCTMFTYAGGAGSFNNFANQQDCDNFCKQLLCERGTPIKDATGRYQQCNSNSACPSSHECSNSVCCPSKQTVCAQPKMIGTCGQYVQRFWYNAVTKDCELFTFSGCQGNDNNFQTLIDCQNFCRNTNPEPQCIQGQAYKDSYGNFYKCSNTGIGNVCPANYECFYDGFQYGCCPTQSYTCSLMSNAGVQCGPSSIRWYYDSTTQSCQTFEYRGCDGSSNNFASRELCEAYCSVGGCPNGGSPYREDSTNQIRICSASITCPSTHDCNTVTIGGNLNNYCCPTKAYICSLPPNQGGQSCTSTTLTRWYFNMATKQCSTFTFNGCGSNANNFAALSQCTNYCSSAACTAGEAVFLDQTNKKPISCNVALQNSCPSGYKCKHDSLTGSYVCCGATNMGVCPSTEKAYVNVITMSVRQCTPNVVGTCPSNYLCRFDTSSNKYYCCTSSSGSTCPTGKSVFKDSSSGQPQVCMLGSTINTCPNLYSCQSAVSGTFQGYCCSVNTICPGNGEYSINSNTGNPTTCTLGATLGCPNGYTCQSNVPTTTTGYCCKEVVIDNAVCGIQTPYMVNGRPAKCVPSAANNCPAGYLCTKYGSTSSYYCCESSVNPGDGCPPGGTLHPTTQVCNVFQTGSCPSGYSCQFSTMRNRYQCCGSPVTPTSDGCPAGQITYKETGTTQTRICVLGQSGSCPVGYSCQWSSDYQRFQCCGLPGGCPSGQVAYVTINGGTQQCSSPGNLCPTGFSCQQGLCCTGGGITPTCSNLQLQILVGNQCLDRVYPGQSCVRTEQCQGGAACFNGVCTCPPGSKIQNSACGPAFKSVRRQHSRPRTVEACSSNQISISNQCLDLVKPMHQCVTTEQCLGDSVCVNNFCSCKPGQTLQDNVCMTTPSCSNREILIENRCLVLVKLGDICDVTKQCMGNSVCENGVCKCRAGDKAQGDSCISVPSKPACPVPGQSPFVVPGTSNVQFCTPGAVGICSAGYTCQSSTNNAGFVCCGTGDTTEQVCPVGTSPYTGPPLYQALVCTSNFFACPTGFTCSFSDTYRQYFCCSTNAPSPSDDGCPSGAAYLYPGTNSPLLCQPNQSQCPGGFSCVYSPTSGRYQCCGARRHARPTTEEVANLNKVEKSKDVQSVRGLSAYRTKKGPGMKCKSHDECVYNDCSSDGSTKICKCLSFLVLDRSFDAPKCRRGCSRGRNHRGVCVLNRRTFLFRDHVSDLTTRSLPRSFVHAIRW